MLSTNYCNYNFSNPDYDIIDRPNGTVEYLFLYFQTPMKIRLDGHIITTVPGACILIPPNTPTYYQAVCHFTNSFVHFYGPDADKIVSGFSNIPLNQIFYPMDVHTINQILKDIYTEDTSRDFLYENLIHNLICRLLITVSRQLGTSVHIPDYARDLYDTFQKARLTILTNPERNWTSASMAALTNLGSSQFYEYYRKFFHQSPKSELLNVRLERAQYMLQHENFNVATVAEYCGFCNLSHFTRYFKKRCGCTPGEFRNQKQKPFNG